MALEGRADAEVTTNKGGLAGEDRKRCSVSATVYEEEMETVEWAVSKARGDGRARVMITKETAGVGFPFGKLLTAGIAFRRPGRETRRQEVVCPPLEVKSACLQRLEVDAQNWATGLWSRGFRASLPTFLSLYHGCDGRNPERIICMTVSRSVPHATGYT